MKEVVSIVVPVFGVEKFIERCAISLFEQDFNSIEYIFVNDCTQDESISILKEVINRYPSRKEGVKIINHQTNRGVAAARNSAIAAAKGNYIMFVDSDDYIDTSMVSSLYAKIKNDDVDMVVCDIMFVWESKQWLYNQNFSDKEQLLLSVLQSNTIISLVNKIFKRSLFIDNNVFCKENVNYGEDFMILPKLIYYSKGISKINIAPYFYSQLNPNSYTTQKLSVKNADDVISVLEEIEKFLNDEANKKNYHEALSRGKIIKKLNILFFIDSKELYRYINVFPETNKIETSFLSTRDKLSFLLVKKQWLNIFRAYRSVYILLFKIKKKLFVKIG